MQTRLSYNESDDTADEDISLESMKAWLDDHKMKQMLGKYYIREREELVDISNMSGVGKYIYLYDYVPRSR